MRVTLIDYTKNAPRLLAFTKGTRLGLNYERAQATLDPQVLTILGQAREDYNPPDAIADELEYMANTIPSSWEFVSYTFLIEDVSRAFTHQFVRNRHGSYAQESLRVVDKSVEGAGLPFVWPDRIHDDEEARRKGSELLAHIDLYMLWLKERGHATEDIRAFLPTNTATSIVARFNLRTMSELAASRSGGRTQGEYQRVMQRMIDRVTYVHPWAERFFFGDRGRDYFDEIEAFAEREYGGDLLKKGELLKIVDKMRKQK